MDDLEQNNNGNGNGNGSGVHSEKPSTGDLRISGSSPRKSSLGSRYAANVKPSIFRNNKFKFWMVVGVFGGCVVMGALVAWKLYMLSNQPARPAVAEVILPKEDQWLKEAATDLFAVNEQSADWKKVSDAVFKLSQVSNPEVQELLDLSKKNLARVQGAFKKIDEAYTSYASRTPDEEQKKRWQTAKIQEIKKYDNDRISWEGKVGEFEKHLGIQSPAEKPKENGTSESAGGEQKPVSFKSEIDAPQKPAEVRTETPQPPEQKAEEAPAEAAKPETPSVEETHSETPIAEPKTEESPAQSPAVEAPVEEPKAEIAKAEEPHAEPAVAATPEPPVKPEPVVHPEPAPLPVKILKHKKSQEEVLLEQAHDLVIQTSKEFNTLMEGVQKPPATQEDLQKLIQNVTAAYDNLNRAYADYKQVRAKLSGDQFNYIDENIKRIDSINGFLAEQLKYLKSMPVLPQKPVETKEPVPQPEPTPQPESKPEEPKPEQPAEQPKEAVPEQPKPEEPAPEQPRSEQPAPEQPADKPAEEPKPEEPKMDEPKPEEPKPESRAEEPQAATPIAVSSETSADPAALEQQIRELHQSIMVKERKAAEFSVGADDPRKVELDALKLEIDADKGRLQTLQNAYEKKSGAPVRFDESPAAESKSEGSKPEEPAPAEPKPAEPDPSDAGAPK